MDEWNLTYLLTNIWESLSKEAVPSILTVLNDTTLEKNLGKIPRKPSSSVEAQARTDRRIGEAGRSWASKAAPRTTTKTTACETFRWKQAAAAPRSWSSFETSILFGKCCSTQYQTFIIQILNWNVNQKLEWNMVTKNLNLANWLFLLPISTFKSNKEVLGLALGFDLRLLSMNSWNVENTNCQFRKLDSEFQFKLFVVVS